MKAFRFGVASIDITPPVGIHMGGYWGRRSGATDIHDRLMAKALVCGCGEAAIAIVAVDIVGLDADVVGDMVLHAIQNDEFYIFTHPEIAEITNARYQDMQAAFARWTEYRKTQGV